MITELPKPVSLRQKNTGALVSRKEGATRLPGFRPDFPPESEKSQGEVVPPPPAPPPTFSEDQEPHGRGQGWGGPGRARPLPCGSVFSPCEGLKGPRGGAGGLVQGGGAAHQSCGGRPCGPLPPPRSSPFPLPAPLPPPPRRQLLVAAAGLSRGGGGGGDCLASFRFLGNPASSLLARELGSVSAAVGAGLG